MAFFQPPGNRSVELVKMAGEKVIGMLHDNQAIVTRKRGDDFFHFVARAELIFATLDK